VKEDAHRLPRYGERWNVSHPDDNAERRFVERLRRRDERAFNELVEGYQDRVYRLVFRMLGRPDEAEDMAQEVFVQVFKAIDSFRGDAKLGTWIYRIAVNLCRNRSKYLARRKTNSQQEYDSGAEGQELASSEGVTVGETAAPDQLVQGYQLEAIMQQCIRELEDDYRDLIILRDVEDLTYEEIMDITGLPEGTVKSRIHRARGALKARLARRLGEKVG
jgi:RNA polymerase sigma-70 factor, ECF subfamily